MKEYKQFIGEAEEEEEMDESADDEEDMEEGIEDRLKDLDPKNPVNVPAYQRKAKSGDSAAAAKGMPTKEGNAFTAKLAKTKKGGKFDLGGKKMKDTSNYLHSLGIPGIRYLDQGSRGAGEGTSNYVVFNDLIPRIVEKLRGQ